MNKIAVFPGSFSPFTLGHKAVVDSALTLFDKVIIAVGNNSEKNEYFSIEERLDWINAVYGSNPKIEIERYEGLGWMEMEVGFLLPIIWTHYLSGCKRKMTKTK